jgi:hypothetical protein
MFAMRSAGYIKAKTILLKTGGKLENMFTKDAQKLQYQQKHGYGYGHITFTKAAFSQTPEDG